MSSRAAHKYTLNRLCCVRAVRTVHAVRVLPFRTAEFTPQHVVVRFVLLLLLLKFYLFPAEQQVEACWGSTEAAFLKGSQRTQLTA